MDTRYETFYSLPPKCLSFLNLVVPAPFDIGKVEAASAAAAFRFPFARGAWPL